MPLWVIQTVTQYWQFCWYCVFHKAKQNVIRVFGQPFVKRFTLCYQNVVLSDCHFLLDGDAAPLPKRGLEPPIFGPCLLWPNGWMDQDGTWHGGGPWPRPHCDRWGPSSPPQKGGRVPQFLAHFYCGQTAGWIKVPLGMEVGLGPGNIVLDGDPAPPPLKGHGTAPNFRPVSVVAKRLDGLRCHLVWR